MTSAEAPVGYTRGNPQITSPAEHVSYASVPSTAPIVYIEFDLNTGPAGAGRGTLYTQAINETIGDVGSAELAVQTVARIRSLQRGSGCISSGRVGVTLPGSVPGLVVVGDTDSTDIGSGLAVATLVAAKGSFVINITWDNGTYPFGRTAPPGATTPRLPNPAEMGSVVDAALARIPSG